MSEKMRQKQVKLKISTIADATIVGVHKGMSAVALMRNWIEEGVKKEQKELNIKSTKK